MSKVIQNSTLPGRHRSLVDMVAKLRSDFSRAKRELIDVQSENDRLKRELSELRSRSSVSSEFDLSSLRRAVAFHCHPDRGGSASLMSELNTFFDFLSGQNYAHALSARECEKGAA